MFGADTNGKGYRVPRGCGVIQGDGVTYEGLVRILDAVLEAGFSAEVLPADACSGAAACVCSCMLDLHLVGQTLHVGPHQAHTLADLEDSHTPLPAEMTA